MTIKKRRWEDMDLLDRNTRRKKHRSEAMEELDKEEVDKDKRRWEDMDRDILVNIMERVLHKEKNFSRFYSFSICRSWLDALLDVYFPYGHYVFDLRPLPALDTKVLAKGFFISMKLVLALRPTIHYSKLIVGNNGLLRNFKLGISNRKGPLVYDMFDRLAPFLRELDLLAFDSYYRNYKHQFGPYCKKLEAIFCSALTVVTLCRYSKYIHTLRLYGVIEQRTAQLIGKSFPLLKHLEIPSCVLSVNALPIILNGHDNLLTLDTRHCFLASQDRIGKWYFSYHYNLVPDTNPYPGVKALEWKLEEESFQGVKFLSGCGTKF
ncbi:hypothetical protein COLO4_22411 [Corchorus olitorius]|uniref:Uncharacterized protein n=1 Tax=Corchorus olitorius TaxID=93759 RepID=A0A1R3ILW0_9ROSI|nr:hypothetical protein COLO4_22411 [Corchorus olitorius]